MRILSASRNFNFNSEGTPEISQLRSGWWFAQKSFRVLKGRRTFSTVLSGRNFLRTVFQPLRSWLISGCRSATQFAVAAIILFAAFGAMAETTNGLSNAEIQGRNLARQLLEQVPATNSAQGFTLQVRDSKKRHFEIPCLLDTRVTPTNWVSFYLSPSFSNYCSLVVGHAVGKPNQYFYFYTINPLNTNIIIVTNKTEIAFAGSDFLVADLGLEFFHWPKQKILKRENSHTRICKVLESTNPNPTTNSYSRVVSWIDEESLGIVQAYAYDAQGKKLKEFYPKDFKKDTNGQWQVGMMEMDNVQTGSRTRLEFVDLGLGTTNSIDAASGLPQK